MSVIDVRVRLKLIVSVCPLVLQVKYVLSKLSSFLASFHPYVQLWFFLRPPPPAVDDNVTTRVTPDRSSDGRKSNRPTMWTNRQWTWAVSLTVLMMAVQANALAMKRSHADQSVVAAVTSLSVEETKSLPLVCGGPENFVSGTFTAWDYSVVLSMLIISIGIGK